MIAKRTREGLKSGSVIRAMFTEGAAMAEQFGRENVYDYSLGNPATPAPERIRGEIIRLAEESNPLALHGYMNNAGFPEVREAVAKNLNERFSSSYTGEQIVMTVGAAGGLNVALRTILDPGDEVIVFAPYFGEYRNYIENFDGTVVEAQPDPETFEPDLKDFRAKLSERTKAVIINTPNNPTGAVYSEETLRGIAESLTEAEGRFAKEIYLISDEPYRELVYDGMRQCLVASFYPDTISVYSFSKSLSLPGERIGYLAVSGECAGSEELLSGLSLCNRVLGFVNAPSLMQKAVAESLSEKTDLAYYDRNRELLTRSLKEMGFTFLPPKGAFYLWMKTPGEEAEFVKRAKQERLLLVPGSAFSYPGYVRIAYCVSPEMIERSLPSFRALSKEYHL